MVLCRKIARILKIDAPRLAAEVRKPARSECAEKSVSLKPELPDVRLHDQAHGLMVQPIRHHALILRVADAAEQRPRADARPETIGGRTARKPLVIKAPGIRRPSIKQVTPILPG